MIKRDLTAAGPGGSVFALKRFAMEGPRLRVYGVLFLPGRNADRATHSTYYLTLRGADSTHTVALKAVKREDKVRPHMAPGDFGSYAFGYFTSVDKEGVDLSDVPPGTYTAEIAMSTGGGLFAHQAGELEVRENRASSVARRISGRNERVSTGRGCAGACAGGSGGRSTAVDLARPAPSAGAGRVMFAAPADGGVQ